MLNFFKNKLLLTKYTLAGIISYCFYLLLLTLCIEIFNFDKLISAILTYGLAIIFNFLILKFWVFKFDLNIKKTFLKYNVVGILGYFLNNFGFWFYVDVLNLHYLKAQVFLFFIVAISNFILNKSWTFKTNQK